ncbi:MAG: threonylcarbamoyl-AMP synthase [Candidatus Colwellbacteria bacterium CG10_big_fil_rev_8_21_14_0_10_42_22]|uniref:L-threonylcarbamoyladenylate synthase n=1 Tax=Candidatus Colwellbacteria bacterium CG10_big_fil_rev_8_21_14_0_10_42_22 TaxID=1974540 RepID=A0A2H0VFB3_9BACT|nr:MAG: threonylcarbamoyl-AMP synthase [Candidatus Colwellbacteria bacterium CG10_big_fil_rev_8_21_14_0_10_42_22]
MLGSKKEIEILRSGGIGVIPTDTLYGIVAPVFSQDAVNRIYELKNRDYNKPFVILLSSIDNLGQFKIALDDVIRQKIKGLWPGPVSIILPCPFDEYEYLHRGRESLAFRVPADDDLIGFLEESGPLVAPSANPQGEKPIINIKEAKKYFGKKVDFYIDGGDLEGSPSTLVKFRGQDLEVLRQGNYKIEQR